MTKPTKNAHDTSTDDEERSMPLSFEESGESITVASGASRKRFGFGTMVFASVAAVAVVSLYSMRAIGHATASTDAPTDAGKMVDEFLNRAPVNSAAKDLADDPLFMDAAAVRIERDELTKDPFVLIGENTFGIAVGGSSVGMDAASSQDPAARRAMRVDGWIAVVEAGAADMRVQSVLVSARADMSMANVNGKVLVVGNTISSPGTHTEFTVTAIAAEGVSLRATDAELGCERTVMVPVKRTTN